MATATVTPAGARKHALSHIASALEAAADALRVLADSESEPAPLGPDPLLTVTEAAAHLRRSSAHVRQQCRSGALRAMRDGQGWRIRRSELDRYERRRTP